MKWEPAGASHPIEFFGAFAPEEVLYDFDGPRIFTIRSRHGGLLLVFQCDEDEAASRFVAVPCDAELVDALKQGRRSVRDALTQPWTWLLDQPHGQPLQSAWRAHLDTIPQELLPGESVMLLPTMTPLPSLRPSTVSAPATRRRGARIPFPVLTTIEAHR